MAVTSGTSLDYEGMEFTTFLLAVIGYAGLTVANILAWLRPARLPRHLVRATAAVVVMHVVLVWSVRYDWQFALALRHGFAGFLIFHTALALIVAAAFANARTSGRLVRVVFPIVTLGAVAAVFSDGAVVRYRVVVVALAAAGLSCAAFGLSRRPALGVRSSVGQ